MNIYCKNLANKSRQLNLILSNETNNRFLSTICSRYIIFNLSSKNSIVDVNNYRFNSIASQNRNLTKKSSRNNNGSINASKHNSKKKHESFKNEETSSLFFLKLNKINSKLKTTYFPEKK